MHKMIMIVNTIIIIPLSSSCFHSSTFLSIASTDFGEAGSIISSILLSLTTMGCLSSGISLQRYVINVQLGNATMIKVLMHLNFTMFLITATYGLRALLVLSLYSGMPSYYTDAFAPITNNYTAWIITTRWLPSVFCSLCLANEMKRQRGGVVSDTRGIDRGSSLKSVNTAMVGDDFSRHSMRYDLLHLDNSDGDQLNPLSSSDLDPDETSFLYHHHLHPSLSTSSFGASNYPLDTSSIHHADDDDDSTLLESINYQPSSEDSNSIFRLNSTAALVESVDYFFSRKALFNIRAVSSSDV